jgi:uncharacterized membrane protein YgdD (TMEM256/DUF423 family)
MNRNLKIFGAFFGMTAVIIGAFGAHALAETLSAESLKSFETGVKYQMYHALLMIILGFNARTNYRIYQFIFYLLVFGVFFFSGSIYLLATNSLTGFNFTSIALVTPFGGSLLIISWLLIFISFWSKN